MITVDAVEARILGVLAEKEMTTPDVYPLTLAGVVAGCNQSTNRDPVMSVDEGEVEAALTRLHDAGLARRFAARGIGRSSSVTSSPTPSSSTDRHRRCWPSCCFGGRRPRASCDNAPSAT